LFCFGICSLWFFAMAPVFSPLPTMRLKVIVLGESKSGKTELIKRYRFEHHSKHPNLAVRYPDDEFNKDYSPTLGVDFFDAVKVRKRRENGETLRVVTGFYDMGGDIKFLKVRSEFYADYSGIILCFDTTSRASFAGLQFWIDEAEKFGQNKKPTNVVVVGTRVDDTMERVVTAREAKQWASERKFTYFDTSAYTGQGVVEAVESLLDKSSATYRQPNIKMPKATTSLYPSLISPLFYPTTFIHLSLFPSTSLPTYLFVCVTCNQGEGALMYWFSFFCFFPAHTRVNVYLVPQ